MAGRDMAAGRAIGKRWLGAAMLLLAACATPPGPSGPVGQAPAAALAARGDGLLRQTMLEAHNAARRAVGVQPLRWNPALAADAQGFADRLAHEHRFHHALQPTDPSREGENLWAGTRGGYAYREMVSQWVDERRRFVDGAVPAISTSGRWADTLHYAQIVWRGTTAMGCALATDARVDYLVCRYAPAGNMVGQRAF